MAHWSGEWGNSGGEWEGDEATTGASFDRLGGGRNSGNVIFVAAKSRWGGAMVGDG